MHLEGRVDGRVFLLIACENGGRWGALTFWRREGRFGRPRLDEGMVVEVNFTSRMHVGSSTEAVCGGRMRDQAVAKGAGQGCLAEDGSGQDARELGEIWKKKRGGRRPFKGYTSLEAQPCATQWLCEWALGGRVGPTAISSNTDNSNRGYGVY